MHNRIVCTCVAFPHYGLACAFSDLQLDQRNLHILHICVLSPQCATLSVGDHVPPQMSYLTK